MNTLVRLLGALAEINSNPSGVWASHYDGETRAGLLPEDFDMAEALEAVKEEFSTGFKVSCWHRDLARREGPSRAIISVQESG